MDDKLRFYYSMSEDRYNEIFGKKPKKSESEQIDEQRWMTPTQLVELARTGKRIHGAYSLYYFDLLDEIEEHSCTNNARCIVCDGDNDVLECAKCGKQWVARCNFDENYA